MTADSPDLPLPPGLPPKFHAFWQTLQTAKKGQFIGEALKWSKAALEALATERINKAAEMEEVVRDADLQIMEARIPLAQALVRRDVLLRECMEKCKECRVKWDYTVKPPVKDIVRRCDRCCRILKELDTPPTEQRR